MAPASEVGKEIGIKTAEKSKNNNTTFIVT
jgi:hypothetical protein